MARSISRAFAAAAAVAVLLSAPATASEEPLAGLDTALETARVQWKAPGLAVAIVKDDNVVFMKGFGSKHLGANAPVDAHTVFTLASTTKAFVALAIGILVDEGKLGWDDPVIRHIPEFRVADPYVTSEVTIRDLLVHRTGIEAMDILWSRGFDTPTSLQHMQHASQASSLRSTWAYNNMMYVVAAEVVARVSGVTFQEFVRTRIFEPLGMTDSLFTGSELSKRDNVTGAHLIERGELARAEPYLSASPLGAAGIQSSVADMAKWLRLLLNKGSVGGREIIRAQTVAESLKPQMLLAKVAYPAAEQAGPHFYAYGLGWFVQDYKGRLLAMHTGSLFGANALVALVPEERLGLVILINAGPVEYRHAFMYDVIDRFLNRREKDWNAELLQLYANLEEQENKARTKALSERAADIQPSLPLAAYAGTYANPLAGEAEIILLQDGRLLLAMRPNAVFSLSHWSHDTFEASDDRAPSERFLLTFTRGADGKVSGYDIPGGRTYKRP